MKFSKIIITNVTTRALVATLDFNEANEKAADKLAREHNLSNPHIGMLSVHYQ